MFKLTTKHFYHVPMPETPELNSPDQCGSIGKQDYRCKVTIWANETLNARGFVIDHSTIRKLIMQAFESQIGSCEQMALKIGLAVKNELIHEDVGFYRVHVKVQPSSTSPYEFGSVTYIHTFQST